MSNPSSPSISTVLFGSDVSRPPSAAELYSVWKVLRLECSRPNERFLACKAESADPAHCVKQGLDCTYCAKNVFRAIEESPCAPIFDAHVYCYTAHDNQFGKCHKTEDEFLTCFEKEGKQFLKKKY